MACYGDAYGWAFPSATLQPRWIPTTSTRKGRTHFPPGSHVLHSRSVRGSASNLINPIKGKGLRESLRRPRDGMENIVGARTPLWYGALGHFVYISLSIPPLLFCYCQLQSSSSLSQQRPLVSRMKHFRIETKTFLARNKKIWKENSACAKEEMRLEEV